MKLRLMLLGFIAASVLLGACSTQQATPPTVTWTPIPPTETASEVPSPTQIVRGTLPPTWTLEISYTPSITPTSTVTLTPSRTFTPTRTFTPSLTASQTYTPTPDLTNQALLSQPLAEVCTDFSADPTRDEGSFTFGTAPTIYWTEVETAAAYDLRLFDSNRVTVASDTTTDTEYTFDAALFNPNGFYGWEVSPLDADGVPICPARGSILRPAP